MDFTYDVRCRSDSLLRTSPRLTYDVVEERRSRTTTVRKGTRNLDFGVFGMSEWDYTYGKFWSRFTQKEQGCTFTLPFVRISSFGHGSFIVTTMSVELKKRKKEKNRVLFLRVILLFQFPFYIREIILDCINNYNCEILYRSSGVLFKKTLLLKL